jgi:hypothetical protein
MANASNLGAAKVRVEWTTHERSMTAYDQLPAEIKAALAEASYDMSNEYVLDLWRDNGLEHVLSEIAKSDTVAPVRRQPKRERTYR